MGFPTSISTPPAPPPPPPAAAPATDASGATQSAAQGAQNRMKAAAGAGFENTLFTNPQGVQPGPTAKQQLLGT